MIKTFKPLYLVKSPSILIKSDIDVMMAMFVSEIDHSVYEKFKYKVVNCKHDWEEGNTAIELTVDLKFNIETPEDELYVSNFDADELYVIMEGQELDVIRFRDHVFELDDVI